MRDVHSDALDDASDAEPVAWGAAARGDAEAFAVVFDRHADRVFRHARRLVTNSADAEDVTAMVFFEAWRSRKRVRVVDGSVIAWLLVTAANLARNLERSRARYERALRRVRVEDAPDHAEAVLDELSTRAVEAPVRAAFGGLSRADQEILALCVLEGLPPRQVAAMMRLPSGTVRTRLSRAKQRLRVGLAERHSDEIEGWIGA